MDDTHVVIERDSGSGAGMGVVLGVILAIVVAMALMWFVFGAHMFSGAAGGSQSRPNNAPDVNIAVPNPNINITVPAQPPVAPAQPSGGATQP